jgi:hypothetical protein
MRQRNIETEASPLPACGERARGLASMVPQRGKRRLLEANHRPLTPTLSPQADASGERGLRPYVSAYALSRG